MDWRRIQSGRGGAGAQAARAGLSVLSGGWWTGLRLRDLARALGLARVHRLPVPVISVGNVTAGGTGKTPLVAWLVERLTERGHRPGILSRGYGAKAATGDLSDEGAVLRHALGASVPQVEDPDRVRGGRRLLAEHPEVDVLVLDDGFQHRRLARDLDIVLVDATCPFGYGHLLPRGLLREAPRALERAGAVVLTRSEQVSTRELDDLRQQVLRLTRAPIAVARTVAAGEWSGRSIFAACAIGNADGFSRTLELLGARVVGRSALPDHAPLGEGAWARWAAEGKAAGADLIVVTRKDAVKRATLPPGFAVLDIRTDLVGGEEDLMAAVSSAVTRETQSR